MRVTEKANKAIGNDIETMHSRDGEPTRAYQDAWREENTQTFASEMDRPDIVVKDHGHEQRWHKWATVIPKQ
ncbi:hypothetical protein R1flu_019176 [Riccia fluitans]|uniref:Uncharacterized protein n=1 Tax=Riccia fluitans TaxID=41844 RepID=A0ABD1ZI34_9MARC